MLPLRPFQVAALDALEKHPHILVISPPGSGKSRIFQEYLIKYPSKKAWLITPLVALGRQHRRDANAIGYMGRLEILSPEALARPDFGPKIPNPDLLIVDECHCLWEWGDRFRPAFLGLPSYASPRRSLWLSATMPTQAKDELAAKLPSLIQIGGYSTQSTLRLKSHCVSWPERPAFAAHWIRLQQGPGVVFVLTRRDTVRITRFLRAARVDAYPYHAGLSIEEKLALEKRIRDAGDSRTVLVATVAFGLGMNLPNLRWTLVWQALPTVVALVQAAGRVGRTGRVDSALILWNPDDRIPLEGLVRSERSREELDQVFRLLQADEPLAAGLTKYFEGSGAILPRSGVGSGTQDA